MHGVEAREQPPDETRPLPGRQRAVELADRGGRGFEHVEGVLEGGKTGCRRAEAPPALRIEFVDAGVQRDEARYYGLYAQSIIIAICVKG
jgi:hypothetical protein